MAEELTQEQKKDIMDFQGLQQQLQMMMVQRQQFTVQLAESKKALEEVKKSEGGLYRFAGTVMIPKKKDDLEKELAGEIEAAETRTGLLQKQEEKVRERLQALAKKLDALDREHGHSHRH